MKYIISSCIVNVAVHGGRLAYAPMVILVATHGDLVAGKAKDTKVVQQRANQLLANIKRQFSDELFFTDHAYVCDARQSSDVTDLRLCLEEVKVALKEVLLNFLPYPVEV